MNSDDIVKLGEDLAKAIVQAAQDQLTKAQAELDRAKSVADIVLAQANDEARRIDEGIASRKAATEKILEGYTILEGQTADDPRRPGPPPGIYNDRDDATGRAYRDELKHKTEGQFFSDELSKLNSRYPSLVGAGQTSQPNTGTAANAMV
jgi:hypothetical protein